MSSLTDFLKVYPRSGWAASVWANLGVSYLHYGYFSRAIDAWRQAWTVGKDATDPKAKAQVDRAVGELSRLYSEFGQFDELSAFFSDTKGRAISGSATEGVQTAQETLAQVKKDPRHLFICGPMALKSLMMARGANYTQVRFLDRYRATPKGTSLAEVGRLADQAKFGYRLIFRQPGQPVPQQAIVHWKVGHFAAIVGQANGRYHVEDPVFPGQEIWVTPAALDAEASGYFLVPEDAPNAAGWRSVGRGEAGRIWGRGPTNGPRPGGAGDPNANGPGAPGSSSPAAPQSPAPWANGPNSSGEGEPGDDPGSCPLCAYNIKESSVSVSLSDTPVGYVPPIGPSAKVSISYNQREDSQPAVFAFFNVSPKWTLNWLSYVTDDPTNPGASVTRYMSGGGAFYYTGYNSRTGQFAAQDTDGSVLVLANQSMVSYQRQRQDGTVEVYAQSDGSTSYPRNVFLSKVIDPQGNAVTLNYDSQMRLTSLVDAAGRSTNFSYAAPDALLVTQITDPFGRSAKLTYDVQGRLTSITDIIGLTSQFTYDSNSLVNSLTTPYGQTTFAYTAPGTAGQPAFAQATDPLGLNEREEWLEPSSNPASDPASTVPQGMPAGLTNQYLEYRNSFHWDKDAYVAAGCTPTGGCDYTKARISHFAHVLNTSLKSTTLESIKYPLENRIWYEYPGQTGGSYQSGSFSRPLARGRVLDDGTTQLSLASYDATGYYNLTQAVDPVGRTTSYAYGNGIDLSAVSQTTAAGVKTTVAQYVYNARHRPTLYVDAAGQATSYTYNAAGQVLTATNALGQTTAYNYNATGDLLSVVNANNQTAASFTYDGFDRIATYTDSEGWSVAYSYDNADRVTKVTYPDGTAETYTYNKLDLASYQDRQARVWIYAHDADRRLTGITDPTGNQTQLGYNGLGEVTSLKDPKGNQTAWTYDVEGRLVSKQYADSSTVTNAYEATTSRLKSVTDALSQVKTYSYAEDNRLTGIAYTGTVNPTPNVTYAYDPYFPRLASMADDNGTTLYSYTPVSSLGALQLQQETGPFSNDSIAYAYDALGRLASRTVAGAGPETFQYDAIGRLSGHASDLGAFTLSYLGQTAQITQRQLTTGGSSLATAWSYLNNAGDRRLAGISNTGLASGQFTNFQFTTTPENQISGIVQTSDATVDYPAASGQTATYNNLNQLSNLSGQALSFDTNGNLLSDGMRTYSWDAENRLVGIAYPAQPGKQTAFAYDGLSRRTAITSTPAGGGSAATTTYIWCGSSICQARNASGATTRGYYAEGEFVPGGAVQPYYYGVDQIGSVRRVFASTASAPAYDYDPNGNILQSAARSTDLGYAGMFYNADSGLYLTLYRAYDANAGRWLSRDPVGEVASVGGNLYAYVNNDPVENADRLGLATAQIGFGGSVSLFGATFAYGGGVALDSQGNVGLYSYQGGGASVGAGGNGGVSVQVSNAQTISDLSGPFGNSSVSAGDGVAGSFDAFTGSSDNGPVVGGGVTFGAGAGASGFLGATTTQINPLFHFGPQNQCKESK
ncbi:MAG: RHS repeat-associated core domain-containing protein [Caulobacteraceae bacterium]